MPSSTTCWLSQKRISVRGPTLRRLQPPRRRGTRVSALTPTPRQNSSALQIGSALQGAQAVAKQHSIRIRLYLENDWLRVSGYRSKRNSASGARSERRSRCVRVDSQFGAERLIAMVAEV